MRPLAKYAIAAAAVVVIAIVGINMLGAPASSNVGGGPPTPSPSPVASPSPSAAPPSPPTTPSGGALTPGSYRWTSPGGDLVTFTVPAGWNGRPEGFIGKREDTTGDVGFGWYRPGTLLEVDHVYTDACSSENKLVPIGDTVDDLVAALDAQVSTDAVVTNVAAETVVGKRVALDQSAGVDRSTCRHGAEGPLQIWADATENTYFALSPGTKGVVYIFDVGGERWVFTGDFGPSSTPVDVAEADVIVSTFEFSPS
jgi:hypothetical protein